MIADYEGTSDEHLSLVEHLAPLQTRLSAVLVTTPQAVALLDAVKGLSFLRAVNVPLLGLVENMSGYVCPCCGEISNVFSTGGGQAMAERENVPFLGSLPVDTDLVTLLDAAEKVEGSNDQINGEAAHPSSELSAASPSDFELYTRYEQTSTAPLFKKIADKIIETLGTTQS